MIHVQKSSINILIQVLENLECPWVVAPTSFNFFGSNIPTNVSDQAISSLLNEKFSGSNFTRLRNSTRCAFINIPSEIVNQDPTLINACDTNIGVPIDLPSLPFIYFKRPRLRKTFNSIKSSNSNISSSKSFLMAASASNIVPTQHMQNIEMRKLETRISKLEKSQHNLENQMTLVSKSVNYAKLSQIESSLNTLHQELNNNIHELVTASHNQLANKMDLLFHNITQSLPSSNAPYGTQVKRQVSPLNSPGIANTIPGQIKKQKLNSQNRTSSLLTVSKKKKLTIWSSLLKVKKTYHCRI